MSSTDELDSPTSAENRPPRLQMIARLRSNEAPNADARLLLRFLADFDWLVQQAAFEALSARRDLLRRFLPELISLLEHKEDRVKWRVCELLTDLGSEAASALEKISRLKPDEVVSKAVWKISGRTDMVVPDLARLIEEEPREGLLDLIYEIGPEASPAVPAIIRCLQIDDADLKWAAIDALGAIGPKAAEAAQALVKLLNHRSGLVAGRAACALASIGPIAVPAIIDALRDGDARTKEFAADALSQIGDAADAAAPSLRQLLSDPNPDVVAWVAVALAKVSKENSVATILRKVIEQTSNDFLRQNAQDALNQLEARG
jgi:HEAT repeat protein